MRSHLPRHIFSVLLLSLIVTGSQLFVETARCESPTAVSANSLSQPNPHSSIVVTINSRFPEGGNGSATIRLLNSAGEVLAAMSGSYLGLAQGTKGPHRDVHFGDTPFGVYRFVTSEGGTADSQIDDSYGTGKLYLDDHQMFGEVIEVGRGTIRLHGGGSGLLHPYAPQQPLVKTHGCIRMKNEDVNALIQLISGLAADQPLEFIFMGSNTYLSSLANNAALANKSWWSILRTDLHLPPVAPSNQLLVNFKRSSSVESSQEPADVQTAELTNLVKLFASDSGPRGSGAFNQLQSKMDALVQLQGSLPVTDPLRPMLAFTFAYSGRNWATNVEVIESGFSDAPPYKEFYADQAESMLSRLIDKASKDGRQDDAKELILKLLSLTPNADGALSEGLSVTLSTKLRDQTATFLAALDEVSTKVAPLEAARVKTSSFELIQLGDYLTSSELTTISKAIDQNATASPDSKNRFRQFRKTYLKTRTKDKNFR